MTPPQAAPTSVSGRSDGPNSAVTSPPSQTTSATSTTYRTASIQIIIISGLQTQPLAELQRIADRVVDAIDAMHDHGRVIEAQPADGYPTHLAAWREVAALDRPAVRMRQLLT